MANGDGRLEAATAPCERRSRRRASNRTPASSDRTLSTDVAASSTSAPGRRRCRSRCCSRRAGGNARLARQRHVGDGDEPSRQGVHRRSTPRPKPTCASCSAFRRTTRCCSCRAAHWRRFALVPMNLLRGRRRRRLRRHRRVVEEVDQGGAEVRQGERRCRRARTRTSPTCRRSRRGSSIRTRRYVHVSTNETIGGVEYSLDARHRRRAARGRHVVAHPVAAARRRRGTA